MNYSIHNMQRPNEQGPDRRYDESLDPTIAEGLEDFDWSEKVPPGGEPTLSMDDLDLPKMPQQDSVNTSAIATALNEALAKKQTTDSNQEALIPEREADVIAAPTKGLSSAEEIVLSGGVQNEMPADEQTIGLEDLDIEHIDIPDTSAETPNPTPDTYPATELTLDDIEGLSESINIGGVTPGTVANTTEPSSATEAQIAAEEEITEPKERATSEMATQAETIETVTSTATEEMAPLSKESKKQVPPVKKESSAGGGGESGGEGGRPESTFEKVVQSSLRAALLTVLGAGALTAIEKMKVDELVIQQLEEKVIDYQQYQMEEQRHTSLGLLLEDWQKDHPNEPITVEQLEKWDAIVPETTTRSFSDALTPEGRKAIELMFKSETGARIETPQDSLDYLSKLETPGEILDGFFKIYTDNNHA